MTSAQRKIENQQDRALDPNVLQRKASHPEISAWVNASAGTGKTKVLSDRVLRLLLPRSQTHTGTEPHKILCLTFTKAGATEMSERIESILAQWSVMNLQDLTESLEHLTGKKPEDYLIKAAQQLFAKIIDAPQGLRIMTIHSFCQSLLGRFPLEAGLHPKFSVLEGSESTQLLDECIDHIFANQQASKDIITSIKALSVEMSEAHCRTLLYDLSRERYQFEKIISQYPNIEALYTAICEDMGILPNQSEDDFIAEFCFYDEPQCEQLRTLQSALSNSSSKTDQSLYTILNTWIEASPEKRTDLYKTYSSAFLTKDGYPRKTIVTKKICDKNPDILAIIETELDRLQRIQDQIKCLNCAQITRSLFIVGQQVLDIYQKEKFQRGSLDFDDLILKTLRLLKAENMASWVLYKLDHGLDHILVDEAQDTNPEQWEIIESLCLEFFSGYSQQENKKRTVFIVGDEKQSIYSFQRAAPEEYFKMKEKLQNYVLSSGNEWESIDLNISFRSAKSVLDSVDHVFSNPNVRKGVSSKHIAHESYRLGQEGHVEFWPLYQTEKIEYHHDNWPLPTETQNQLTGSQLLSEKLAENIESWLRNKKPLESYNRPIQPSDIMILVRTRTEFVSDLMKALKKKNIPVSGSDRMALKDHLVIRDLIAAAEFSLLSCDDLILACLLKSPLIGLNEDQLFDLAYKRETSLWERLQNSKEHSGIADYLSSLKRKSHSLKPYAFFNFILQNPCPAHKKSGFQALISRLGYDCYDIVQDFLSHCLNDKQNHAGGLQKFIYWHKKQEHDFKANSDHNLQAVRIMTVHGSKGLQAPIVILPDTIRSSRSVPGQTEKNLLWPHKTGLAFPLCCTRKTEEPNLYKKARENIEEKLDEEYRRLLYVAMTRAENKLYICGHAGIRTPLQDSWYFDVQQALEQYTGIIKEPDGTLTLSNPQNRPPDKAQTIQEEKKTDVNVPEWLFQPVSETAQPYISMIASSSHVDEDQIFRPISGSNNKSQYLKGNIIHKLLELLPDIHVQKRESAAQHYLSHYKQSFNEAELDKIWLDINNILSNTDFSRFFTSQSRAEVPVSGYIKNELINAQIDRLAITETDIWIVDYKSQSLVPDHMKDVPAAYLRQMRLYKELIHMIYPDHNIHCGLLWTSKPKMMVLDDL